MKGVEFTDRYGGRAPSWLRACHGECEAMGVVPIFEIGPWVGPGDAVPTPSEGDGLYRKRWDDAHTSAEHDCDGWHFVKCLDCEGTGRVSWLVSVARVPRWFAKGCRQAWWFQSYPGPMPGQSRWAFIKVSMWACFGADLQALRR